MFLSQWREFPSAPCLAEKKNWQLAPRCYWHRARPWHTSGLVSFLVGLRTYQHPGTVNSRYSTTVGDRNLWRYIGVWLYISERRLCVLRASVDWSVRGCGYGCEESDSLTAATCIDHALRWRYGYQPKRLGTLTINIWLSVTHKW